MDKTKILFVCLGNICRSPAAEGIMKRLVEERGLADDFVIDSAGIGSWHVGQLPDRRMRQHGARHGYDFNSRARQISRDDFRRFDYIVVMDEENRHDVLRLSSDAADRQRVLMMADYLRRHPQQYDVPDPYYGGDRDFELVIELLEDACEGLLDQLKHKSL
ncbi:MAG: low molecular weight phosphotyrosine protein phosphatase [Prevotella sp.]|nr:low molecular weight phosphotyrosine protein phosphatase [Prevotella sp.]